MILNSKNEFFSAILCKIVPFFKRKMLRIDFSPDYNHNYNIKNEQIEPTNEANPPSASNAQEMVRDQHGKEKVNASVEENQHFFQIIHRYIVALVQVSKISMVGSLRNVIRHQVFFWRVVVIFIQVLYQSNLT